MRTEYPSDISREQFAQIQPILESARKKTKPRTVDLYDVFCAVLYVLRTGCQWRALPHDFPKWTTVYFYYRLWGAPGKREEGKQEESKQERGKPEEGKQEEDSLFEVALKKAGSCHSQELQARALHDPADYRLPKRQEYGYGARKGL